MFHWVYGQPPMVMREQDLGRWQGGSTKAVRKESWAEVRNFDGACTLVLRDHELSTFVPLELGGALLVTAFYCDGDKAVNGFLDVIPVTGWDLLTDRFISDGSTYVFFNSAIKGADFSDAKMQKQLLEEHGGLLKFPLARGTYEVETYGPWRPDTRTELFLARMVRVGK